MNNITEKPPRGGASSRWRFVVEDGILTLQRNTDEAVPFRTYETVATFGDDGTVALAGDVSFTGSANTLTLAGSATGEPVTISSTGSDASIPIKLAPKGNQGFVQFGADTYGAAGWADYDVGIEMYDTATKTANSTGIAVDRAVSDSAGGFITSVSAVAKTQGVGATQDISSIIAGYFSGESHLPSGRTATTVQGFVGGVYVTGGGVAGSAYGMSVQALADTGSSIEEAFGVRSLMYDTVTVPNTGKQYAFAAYRYTPVEAANAEAYSFWADDLTGAAVNAYFLWYNSAGVYRVKSDGVMAYYNPGFATKYTPGAANYERIVQQWNGNVAEYGVEVGGTGTMRPLKLLGNGFFPPLMTTTQRDAISSPAEGLVIYNTSSHVLNFYNGSAWGAV